MFLELINEVHGVNGGLRSRRAAVNLLGSGQQLSSHTSRPSSSCLSPFSGNANAKILMSGSLRRATSIKLRAISV
jgi:hypothetical protein